MLVGGEIQKHILRGHEGTRAEHVRRRQIELYGLARRAIPEPRPARDDEEKWWRRHPDSEGPVRPSRGDPPRDNWR